MEVVITTTSYYELQNKHANTDTGGLSATCIQMLVVPTANIASYLPPHQMITLKSLN